MKNNKSLYTIDVAFDTNLDSTEKNIPDGLYYRMKWGMAHSPDDGSRWDPVHIEGRKDGDLGFGRAKLVGETLGIADGDKLVLNVFCNNKGEEPTDLERIDWVRYAFRPSHEVAPDAPHLRQSPLQSNDTDALVKGIKMRTVTEWNSGVSQGIAGGDDNFAIALYGIEQYLPPANQKLSLSNIPSATELFRYEFTVYLKVTRRDDTPRWFKTDPELITGRGGG